MSWGDWAAFLRDLTAVGSLAAVAVLTAKLIRPGHGHDRLAAIALGVATVGALVAALVAPLAGGRLEGWVLFSAPILLLYWWLEIEFGTRILGLAAALATLPGLLLVPLDQAVVLEALRAWPALATSGGLVSGGILSFAAANLILALAYRQTGAMTARKTGRYFAITAETISEVIYRLIAWVLPFVGFTSVAAVGGAWAGGLSWAAPASWGLAAVLTVTYAWRCRRQGYQVGFRPWLLLLATGSALAGLGSLGTLGSVF